MGYKTFVSMNIAIIGCGEIAEAYAAGFAYAGHEVFVALKNGQKGHLSADLNAFENVQLCSIEAAAEVADLIIIATPPKDVREVAYWLGDVRQKVIIDATGNVFAHDDELVKTVCAIGAITGSQLVVKVFQTAGFEQLLKPIFREEKVELILAGDSKKAKEATKILFRDLGMTHSFDFGDSNTVPLFNELTKCCRNLTQKGIPQTIIATLPWL